MTFASRCIENPPRAILSVIAGEGGGHRVDAFPRKFDPTPHSPAPEVAAIGGLLDLEGRLETLRASR